MKVTDTILIEKWKSLRDAEAFTELVRRHSAMVYRVACRILQNPGHAEEVAQECFLLLAQNPSAVKHSPGGWLHALATSRALDRLKAERHRLNRETRYGEQAATISMPQWDDVQRYVDEIVDELPESLRAVIIYRYFEGHSLEETAQHLSVSRTTVQTRLTRSVARIRRALHRRGIPISTGMLLGSLGIGSSEAAPASLTLALGKLTVAGTTGTAAINTTTGILLTGGLLGMKKILILAGILAAAFLAKETLFKADDPMPSLYPAPATGASSPTALVKKIPISGTEVPPPKPSKDTSLIALLAQKLNGQENGSISGIVVDLQGRPMPEMQVFSLSPPTSDVKTDKNGHFELKGLMAGRYALTVRKGPDLPHTGGDEEGTLVRLAAGQHRTDLKLVYDRIWSISGRILNREGNPLADAAVDCGSVKTGGSSTRSKADGTFHLENLAEDAYEIRVDAKGYQHTEISEIKAGRDDVDITLMPVKTITGRVLDAVTGHPIAEFRAGLMFQSEGGLWGGWQDRLETVKDPGGRFSFPAIQPIPYLMVVQVQGYVPESQQVFGGDTEQPQQALEFRMQKGSRDLHGVVQDTEGHLIPDVQVVYGPVQLRGSTPLKTNLQGEFVLNNFPRQAQCVTAYHPSYALNTITIPENADLSKPVTILLGQGGTIRGKVTVGNVLNRASITVDFLNSQHSFLNDRYRVSLPPEGGPFELHALPPGNANLNVFRSWVSTPCTQRQSIVIPVSVEEAKTKEIQVDFPPANGVIEGTVPVDSTTDSTTPKERRKGIVLQLTAPFGKCSFYVEPDAAGLYRFEGVMPGEGTMEYSVETSDYRNEIIESVPVTMEEGQVFHHDFTAVPKKTSTP